MDEFLKILLTSLFATIIPSLIVIYSNRKKSNAEINKTYADIAEQYHQMVMDQAKDICDLQEKVQSISEELHMKSAIIERQTQEIKKKDEIIFELIEGIKLLYTQIEKAQQIPVWKPTKVTIDN